MSTETTDLPISLRCPRVLRNAAEEKAMAELGIKLPELVRNLLIEYVHGPMLNQSTQDPIGRSRRASVTY